MGGRKEPGRRKEARKEVAPLWALPVCQASGTGPPHYLAIHSSQAAWEVDTSDPIFRDWPVIAGGGAGIRFRLSPEPKYFLDFLERALCPVLL